jgi:hypothetical protein
VSKRPGKNQVCLKKVQRPSSRRWILFNTPLRGATMNADKVKTNLLNGTCVYIGVNRLSAADFCF